MRSIFTFAIAILILTACSQAPITATSTPLPSTTPTRISTVTPTVLPTFTPTPPISDLTPLQQEWSNHFAGTAEVRADGNIYSLDGVAIEGLKIDGSHVTLTKTYPELDGDPFTIYLDSEDVKMEDGGVINLPGWRSDGNTLVQEHAVDDNGKETDEIKLPYDVMIEMIIRESTGSMDRRVSQARAWEYLGLDGITPSIRSNGKQYAAIDSYVYSNEIYVVDESGKVVGDKKDVIFYAFAQLKEGHQSVVALQKDGKIVKVFVDARLGKKIYPLVKVQHAL